MTQRPILRLLLAGALATIMSFSGAVVTRSSRAPRRQAPQTLIIPSLGIRAPVESIAYNKASEADAPYRWGDVAWYNRGPVPGDRGNALIYGHYDSYCCPAIFYKLQKLKVGNPVTVVFPGNKSRTFMVRWSVSYWNTKLPTRFMYGPNPQRGLLLITCAGDFHRNGTGYDHQLFVYATMPTPPRPPRRPTPKPTKAPKPKPTKTPKPTQTPQPAAAVPTRTPVPTARPTNGPVAESTRGA